MPSYPTFGQRTDKFHRLWELEPVRPQFFRNGKPRLGPFKLRQVGLPYVRARFIPEEGHLFYGEGDTVPRVEDNWVPDPDYQRNLLTEV